MAPLKQKGDRAELEVARDLVRRGFRIAIPYGEDWDFDLIFQRPDSATLERVQVKHTKLRGQVIPVRCRSSSLTGGRVKRIKRYTTAMIDWLAVFEPTLDSCFYIPSHLLGDGRSEISLRISPSQNGQIKRVRYADAFRDPARPVSEEVEPAGLEPATSAMQTPRSPN